MSLFKASELISNSSFAIFDLETTGLDFINDDILEICIFETKENEIKSKFHSYIKSDKKIRPRITAINKIGSEDVANSPLIDEVAKEIIRLYPKHIFVAHNCFGFDANMLMSKCPKLFNDKMFLDTREMASDIFPNLDSVSMTSLTDFLGIKIKDQHTATGDVAALCKVFNILISKLDRPDSINKYIRRGSTFVKSKV